MSGFPTLKFFPKSNKAGEDYNGGRDVGDFVTFINEKCGTSRDGNGQLTSKVSTHAFSLLLIDKHKRHKISYWTDYVLHHIVLIMFHLILT